MKTSEEKKEYNRRKKREERQRKKTQGIELNKKETLAKAQKKYRENKKNKGLKSFEITNLYEKDIQTFYKIKDYFHSETNSDTFQKMIGIVSQTIDL